MPQKLNKAGKMQDYVPKGNGDASGEYGTSNGTNKNFTTSDKKKTQANVITENKQVSVGNKKETKKEMIHDINKREWYEVKKSEKFDGKYELTDSNGRTRIVDEKILEDIKKSSPLNKKDSIMEDVKSIMEKRQIDDKDILLLEINKQLQKHKNSDNYSKAAIVDMASQIYDDIAKNKKEISTDTKANIINDDLTGKSQQKYSDEDIKNMDADEFGGDTDKESWELITKEFEEDVKPILDKLGISENDIKFSTDAKGKTTNNYYELKERIKNNKKVSNEEKAYALDSLSDKMWYDRQVREYKKTKKAQ